MADDWVVLAQQPLQLLVRSQDMAKAREIAVELLGEDCDMLA